MNIQNIKDRLLAKGIFLTEETVNGKTTVIGYEKRFRWLWMATQLNTFVVATDLGTEAVTVPRLESALTDAFKYAKKHYTGWPRGLQSGLGVIVILLSSSVDDDAATYCRKLKSGKKWAGFSVPVAINTASNQVFSFDRDPMWGRIYYPYFRKMIEEVAS